MSWAAELDHEVARTSNRQNIAKLKICEFPSLPPVHYRIGFVNVISSGSLSRATAEELDCDVDHTSKPQDMTKWMNLLIFTPPSPSPERTYESLAVRLEPADRMGTRI